METGVSSLMQINKQELLRNTHQLWYMKTSSKRFRLYPTYKISQLSDMTLNYDLWPWKIISFSLSWWSSQVYQVVWSWSFWFGPYPAYEVLLLSDDMTLTFDLLP
jgi:hypothetical protein